MTDDILHSVVRRELLTGLGTLAIGGVAATLVGREGSASAASADAYNSSGRVAPPSICVFDVNETLLDIEFIARLVRKVVQRRSSASVQTRAAGVPHGCRGAGCASLGDLHGRRPCMGHDWGSKRWLLGSTYRPARERPLAGAWVAPATGRSARSTRCGHTTYQALALSARGQLISVRTLPTAMLRTM